MSIIKNCFTSPSGYEKLKNVDYRLIAADIDGTLVPFGGEISNEAVKVVKNLRENGYIFVLATGRPYAGVKEIIERCSLEGEPVIVYNGAEIYIDGKKVYSSALKKSVSKKICKIAKELNIEVICWADGKLYAEKESKFLSEYVSISNVAPIIVDDISTLLVDDITKFLYMVDEEQVKPLTFRMRSILSNVNVYSSRKHLIEFVPKDCSKAIALKKVCKLVGVDKNFTIAFGDGENDIDMLKFSALAIAPENACDEIKKIADIVCESVDENGVEKILKELL